ncbi:hypothetical protein [Paenibacillus sp. V4I5]|nr:hypothetical protein [Paenibacillus sp. V4I5]MDQ0916382.1 5'(3')-deoxyribonucleotidase [Paenibacillus sp. V4I5]
MKRIAIDMDEVIADFNLKHLRLFNHDYNENITTEDLGEHVLENYVLI